MAQHCWATELGLEVLQASSAVRCIENESVELVNEHKSSELGCMMAVGQTWQWC